MIIISLLLANLAYGMAYGYRSPERLSASIEGTYLLSITLLIFLWYHVDSTAKNYPRSSMLNVSIVGLSLVALPYYFFRSRGFAKGAGATVLSSLMLLGFAVSYTVGICIANPGAIAEPAYRAPPAPPTTPGQPSIKTASLPVYPRSLVEQGVGGRNIVRVLVGADGSVREATIETSSGESLLDSAALEAARNTKFNPAIVDDKAVSAYALLPFDFSLSYQ
ncbi:MAG: energy transducer TonB [Rudaea sp.]|uniref:energy transducer TonB n=1 Tax=unclassified Rudaea TaxID=2627037 RepID=UPI001484D2E1|nr:MULTISPECIES: energy transducer TonB [unclassified Rudaea]MBN8885972.1 energy transducer TonB [Rudaea sp.]